jgi:hypothetical protein
MLAGLLVAGLLYYSKLRAADSAKACEKPRSARRFPIIAWKLPLRCTSKTVASIATSICMQGMILTSKSGTTASQRSYQWVGTQIATIKRSKSLTTSGVQCSSDERAGVDQYAGHVFLPGAFARIVRRYVRKATRHRCSNIRSTLPWSPRAVWARLYRLVRVASSTHLARPRTWCGRSHARRVH